MKPWETEEFQVSETAVTIAVLRDLIDIERHFVSPRLVTNMTTMIIQAAVDAEERHFGPMVHQKTA